MIPLQACKIKKKVGYEQWNSVASTPFVTTNDSVVTYENVESFQRKVS
jgi:hypothetical protein